MTRPQEISGRKINYTQEALVARVQGVMIVKCVITVEGKLEKCRIIKPLPHMEAAVLDSLYSKRYTPVLFQGKPTAVDYTFTIQLKLPR
jgi:protein TonB